jgi:RNA polymerase sigma factor (sigma-70 family)
MDGQNSISFEEALLPHLDCAFNLARWLTRSKQDAEDVVQESYLRAFLFFPGFRGGHSRAWLMKIVRNTCYTWMKTNRPLQNAGEFDENLLSPDARTPEPEEMMLKEDDRSLLRAALEKLAPNFREVLILREFEAMSYAEIAEVTGMPIGTVMSSLSRARSRLRQTLLGPVSGKGAQRLNSMGAV